MSYKIQKQGSREWLINDNIVVELKRRSLTTWLKENTNSYDSRFKCTDETEPKIIEHFLDNGFTPLIGCYGNKKYDEENAKPFYEVNDTISWFLFDGVSDDTTFPSNCISSFAVNYDKNKGTFTAYHHDGPKYCKRIGIYDDIYDVTELTKDYIPVKIIDRGKVKNWVIDFDKLNICNISNNYCLSKEIHISPAYLEQSIFEERVGNIINNVSKYIIETTDGCYRNVKGLRDEPNTYYFNVNGTQSNEISFRVDVENGGVDKIEGIGFALNFVFNENTVDISLIEKRSKYAQKACTETISVKREYNDDKKLSVIAEEALAYIKTLGVYFADPNDLNDNDCDCKDETEEG